MNVLFPAPTAPVMPTRIVPPVCGNKPGEEFFRQRFVLWVVRLHQA